jgi:predicted dehydrogenase
LKKKIRLAWIGSGFVGQVAHLSSFSSIPDVEIVALSELREELGKRNCQRFGIKKFYKDYKKMLATEKVDAVVCIVRRYQTYEIAKEVLSRKINLFTEKPMAPTLNQANQLVNLAKKNKLIYSVGNMRRHDSGILKAQKLFSKFLKNRALGNFIHYKHYVLAGGDYCNIDGYIPSKEKISKKRKFPDSPDWLPVQYEKKYEKFLNYFIHNFNLLRFYFGKINQIEFANFNDDFGNFHFNHGKFQGSFDFYYLKNNYWKEKLEIIFSDGIIEVDLPPAFLKNVSATVKILSNKKNIYEEKIPSFNWSFKNQAIAFVDNLKNKSKGLSSGQDAINDIKIVNDIWKNKFYNL